MCMAEYRSGLEPRKFRSKELFSPSEENFRGWPILSGIWPLMLMFVLCTLLSYSCLSNYYAEENFDMLHFQLSKFCFSHLLLKILCKDEKAYFQSWQENPWIRNNSWWEEGRFYTDKLTTHITEWLHLMQNDHSLSDCWLHW